MKINNSKTFDIMFLILPIILILIATGSLLWEEITNINWQTFREQFWPQFAATIFGAGLGVYGALLLNRRQEKRQQLEEIQDEKERKDKVLTALREELEIIKEDLTEYKTHLEDKTKETRNLQLIRDETWNAFKAGGELEWIKDPFLLNDFAEAYFLVKKVNYTSEKLFEIIGRGRHRISEIRLQEDRLIDNINQTLEILDELLNLI